jgi:glycosyltransferase involved in cell wall biosynthesis
VPTSKPRSAPAEVSIVVPAFNAEPFITECLKSVFNQTFSDFEVLVVDDGSTDRTVQLAKELERSDQRLRIVSQPNSGVIAARNHGIELASGRWVALLDADDVWHPRKLEAQLSYVADQGLRAPLIVGTRASYLGAVRGHVGLLGSEPIDLERIRRAELLPFTLCSTGLFDRESLAREGGFDSALGRLGHAEDLELLSRLARRGASIVCVPESLALVRLHPESASARQHQRQKFAARYVRELARRDQLGLSPLPLSQFEENYRLTRRQSRSDRCQFEVRQSAVEFVSGNTGRALRHLAMATLIDPRYTVTRLIQKVR